MLFCESVSSKGQLMKQNHIYLTAVLLQLILPVSIWGVSPANQKLLDSFNKRKNEYQKQSGKITLAQDGKPQMVIVVPPDAPAPVRFAGQELKYFMDRITGGQFQIVDTARDQTPAIILGDSPETQKAGIDVSKIARDGYRIIARNDRIFIAGRDDQTSKSHLLFQFQDVPESKLIRKHDAYDYFANDVWGFERGTLYGAYRFLEELGVRWFLPGPKGLVIPTAKNLEISAFDLHEEPVFEYREIESYYPKPQAPSSAHDIKDRLDAFYDMEAYDRLEWSLKENRLWLLRMRSSSALVPLNHRVPALYFEERFGENHPEYFALWQGKRFLKKNFPNRSRTGELCYSSEGSFEETMKDIDAFFAGRTSDERGLPQLLAGYPNNRGWPPQVCYGDMVSLLPHDVYAPCECSLCKPYLQLKRDAGQNSDLVWRFVDKVAREVEKRHPGKMVTCLAYSSYSKLPLTLKQLPDNVIIGICPLKLNKTYNIVNQAGYTELFDFIKQWNAMNAMPNAYWFHHLYRHSYNNQPEHFGVPMILSHFWGKFIKDLSNYGNMMLMQIDQDNPIFEHLNRYLLLRLLWNPDLKVDALLEDYTQKYYGPAGGIIKQTLLDIERNSEKIAATDAGWSTIWDEYFTEKTMKRYRKNADQAVKLTQGTPYAQAAKLFSDHFIGFMEKGYAQYVFNIKNIGGEEESIVSLRITNPKEMKVDGDLSESSWSRAQVYSLTTTSGNKKIETQTTVQALSDWHNLYFAFICDEQPKDSLDQIDIFLDAGHTHSIYAHISIDADGKVTDRYILGEGEPIDENWTSGAEVAVRRKDHRRFVEVRIPRDNIRGDDVRRVGGKPWGVNFCRTVSRTSNTSEQQRSSFSPLIKDDPFKPALFGHMIFR